MFVQRYSAAAPANSPDDTLSSLLSSTLFKLSPLSAILLPRVYPVKGGRGARQNTGGYPAIACRRRSRVSPIPFLFTSFADPRNLSPMESHRSKNTGRGGRHTSSAASQFGNSARNPVLCGSYGVAVRRAGMLSGSAATKRSPWRMSISTAASGSKGKSR